MIYDKGISIGRDWIPLHRNENIFIEDAVIKNLVIKAIKDSSINLYPDIVYIDLRKKLAQLYNIELDNIFLGNGADEILSSLFLIMRKKYDIVNLPRLCFKMYEVLASRYNFKVNYFENYPLIESQSEINTTGFFVIDSPSSITGHPFKKEVLSTLLLNRQNTVVLDNVYGEFENFNISDFNIYNNNLITVRSFSKFYGIAGLRVGYCISSPKIIKELALHKDPFNVNVIGAATAIECLNTKEYFIDIIKEIQFQKEIFEENMDKMQYTYYKSSTYFLLAGHNNLNSKYIYDELSKRKIAVRYFANDDILRNYFRIGVPTKYHMDFVTAALKEISENQLRLK